MSVKYNKYQKYMLYCATYSAPSPNDSGLMQRYKSLVWACNFQQVYDKIDSLFGVFDVYPHTVTLCSSNTVDISEYSQLLYCEQLCVESAVTTKNDYTTHPLYLKNITLLADVDCIKKGSTGIVTCVCYDLEDKPINAVVHIGVWSIAVNLKDIELCKSPIGTPSVVLTTRHDVSYFC